MPIGARFSSVPEKGYATWEGRLVALCIGSATIERIIEGTKLVTLKKDGKPYQEERPQKKKTLQSVTRAMEVLALPDEP